MRSFSLLLEKLDFISPQWFAEFVFFTEFYGWRFFLQFANATRKKKKRTASRESLLGIPGIERRESLASSFFFLVPWPAAPPAALFVFHPRHLCFLLVIWILFLFLVPLSCFVLFCSGPSGNNRCTGGDFWSLTPRSCVVIGAFRRLLLQQLQLIAFAFKRSIRRPRKIGELKKKRTLHFCAAPSQKCVLRLISKISRQPFRFFFSFSSTTTSNLVWNLMAACLHCLSPFFFTEFLACTSWWSWFFFIGEGRFDDFGRHFRLMDPVMEFIGVKPSKTQ